ncbi:hypothetical protein K5B45_000405 [Escherichia coli]|uniref:Uncharacterized protein n=1 Tax=Escherichia coli TaxID=562 RepID=A0A828NXA8_ECOLX|nr:hypothetical protein [Escherichia coli]EEY2482662.1 hypothetical protein [Escherichia coli]EFC3606153.1 hypothetical protein [Escherichia coli]EFE1841167.1 hypothetical protein [Escherichia coli]EFF3876314.1 hypothetical protein [Escherichia coli]EFF3886956.1 hypothetical protein [Escherichia coli]
MTNNTLSPKQDTQTQDDEIIRQKQEKTIERLEAELSRVEKTKPFLSSRPDKFALEDFLAKCPRRRKATRSRSPD